MKRRMLNLSVFVWFLFLVLISVFVRCGGSDAQIDLVTSSGVVSATPMVSEAHTGGLPGGSQGVDEVLGECEAVGLERAGVRWLINGLQLLLFVPMSPEIGEPYVRVWTPDVNSTLLGRGPANEWFSVTLSGYGSWPIRLAAETIDSSGQVRQCDRHKFTVVSIPLPPPPPPKTCEEKVAPLCSVSLMTKARVGYKSLWWAASWELQNFCGQVRLVRNDGVVRKTWNVCAQCEEGVSLFETKKTDSRKTEDYEFWLKYGDAAFHLECKP